ncbi:YjfB family protein [Herbinix luporum]|jgi:hypothetical protein|uniref:Motility protein n=1 Tax=Herbinix luporum TaxID=1679721 RepID=A0A0K8J8X6_9FIRM|nr:YjfB family protein [Herbinix luporum]MDI9488880.1 YjfB family protein [Bacillota bacterium]CUH93708.1 hypothetical protein SD1D_2193 [Herbinix luporum]HHT57267.1 putative motility protein [Herbinix luporum]
MNISLPIVTSPTIDSVDVGVAVLAKNLDTVEELGQSMIKMMEQSVAPYLGQNIDIMV